MKGPTSKASDLSMPESLSLVTHQVSEQLVLAIVPIVIPVYYALFVLTGPEQVLGSSQ